MGGGGGAGGGERERENFGITTLAKPNPCQKPNTLKCLSIGTPKTINFPFVPNGKLIDLRCPNI